MQTCASSAADSCWSQQSNKTTLVDTAVHSFTHPGRGEMVQCQFGLKRQCFVLARKRLQSLQQFQQQFSGFRGFQSKQRKCVLFRWCALPPIFFLTHIFDARRQQFQLYAGSGWNPKEPKLLELAKHSSAECLLRKFVLSPEPCEQFLQRKWSFSTLIPCHPLSCCFEVSS